MKYALAVLAFLVLSISASADSYTMPNGLPLYYPDSATITSVSSNAFPVSQWGTYGLYYSFADGTGETFAPPADSNDGYIFFSTAITAVTFDYTSLDNPFAVTFDSTAGESTEVFPTGAGTETVDFSGDVTEMFWIIDPANWGVGGITSLSYALDGPPVVTPEPGALALSALGLMAVFGLALTLRN